MVIPFLKPEYKNIRWLQKAHPAFIQLSGSREIPDLVWENNIYNLFFKTVIFTLAVKLNVLACTPPVFSKLIWDLWCSGVSDNSWSHLMFLVFDFLDILKTNLHRLQLFRRILRRCFAAEAPEMFCGVKNFPRLSHQHFGELISTEC